MRKTYRCQTSAGPMTDQLLKLIESELKGNMQETQVAVASKGIDIVSDLFGLNKAMIFSNARTQTITDAKSIATWIACRMGGLTLSETAVVFQRDPKRHMTTIRARLRCAIDMASSYPGFKATLITSAKAVLMDMPHDRVSGKSLPLEKSELEILNAIYQHQSPESARTQPSPA